MDSIRIQVQCPRSTRHTLTMRVFCRYAGRITRGSVLLSPIVRHKTLITPTKKP